MANNDDGWHPSDATMVEDLEALARVIVAEPTHPTPYVFHYPSWLWPALPENDNGD